MWSAIELAERGVVPDWLIRAGIRRQYQKHLVTLRPPEPTEHRNRQRDFADSLRAGPMVLSAAEANAQHYEEPSEFFARVLGPRLKYSCCLYNSPTDDLATAEEAMLRLTCERAELADGQQILELGCGWGSLSLWMAEQYPEAKILAISNSRTQREFITARAAERGFHNLEIQTANIADFATDRRFDRVVSVEMFEHVRNYQRLLGNISEWLSAEGKLFVHIFCHRLWAYPFSVDGKRDWMAKHFFQDGLMPSDDLLLYFQDDLALEDHWRINGVHYSQTLEAWLTRMDADRDALLKIYLDAGASAAGPDSAAVRVQRWRMFMMACSELFRYRGGTNWYVSHYRFRKR